MQDTKQKKPEDKLLEKQFDIIATTLPGVEPLLRRELLREGLFIAEEGVRSFRVIGNKEVLYRLNMKSRFALRFLIPVLTFRASHHDELYKKVRRFDWGQFFGTDDTFAIDAVVNSETFRNSRFITYRCKDGIVDHFMRIDEKRPSVSTDRPTVRINLHIQEQKVSISLDSSGDSLHLRGYREHSHPAPMNEILAAALVEFTEWDGHSELIDGMTGSGTIAIEAAMKAAHRAPGLIRTDYGFKSWKNFDENLYDSVKKELVENQKTPQAPITGIDKNGAFIRMAEKHAWRAGVADYIKFERMDFLKFKPANEGGILLLNPPYGTRLEDETDELYGQIGTRLKHQWAGWKAWIISANIQSFHQIGLKPMKKLKLKNGALDCQYRGYELFSGKRVDHL